MRRGDKEFLLDILEACKIGARSPHLTKSLFFRLR